MQAHDPTVIVLPDGLDTALTICESSAAALAGADVLVVCTEWPEYRDLDADLLVRQMRRRVVVDQNHFLAARLGRDPRIIYLATGKAGHGAAQRCRPAA